uniref:RNA polymerase-associated protein LEO1 n=1 Tax=Schistosoma japonicum TaxID=6182 RepID=C1LER3_SCHJA|nr:RNA polymerase-associated protein LEO1 [Schistosoma japonicum]
MALDYESDASDDSAPADKETDESSDLNSTSDGEEQNRVAHKNVFGDDTDSEQEMQPKQNLSEFQQDSSGESNRECKGGDNISEHETDNYSDASPSQNFAKKKLHNIRSTCSSLDDEDSRPDDASELGDNASQMDDLANSNDNEDHGSNADDMEENLIDEPDETRISVDFPLIRADLGREVHLVKMPNFLSVETRPFDPNFYEDELDEDEILDEEGRTRLKLKVENTIRWRIGKTPDGEMVHESNARIVRWSDGSLSLHLGDEIFDIHKVDIQSDYNYLFIREGSGLQGQSSLKTKLTFRPHSTDSFTHRKITLSLADKTNKLQKVKILPVTGADPESNRNMLVRKEEEKLRATLRRESQLRRMREKQAMSRSSFGSERRRSYGEDDDEDDGNTTSLNALKRNAKSALLAARKDVAAIYSSGEESLSDISEPRSRKKVRAKISDEEESD